MEPPLGLLTAIWLQEVKRNTGKIRPLLSKMAVESGWISLDHVWKEGPPDRHKHSFLTIKKNRSMSSGRAFKQGTSAMWPYHMGVGEMDGKIVSEPSVKDSHNTCMTRHENPCMRQIVPWSIVFWRSVGRLFPSQNNVLKGTVFLLTVGSAVSPRTLLRKIPQEYQEGGVEQEYPCGD